MTVQKVVFNERMKRARKLGWRDDIEIPLEKCANKGSVELHFMGRAIRPLDWNEFGHPIFTGTQVQFLVDLSKSVDLGAKELIGEIRYEEEAMLLAKRDIDTCEGIRLWLNNLEDLNELLILRKKYLFSNPEEKLRMFLLFGTYFLSSNGEYWAIKNGIHVLKDVIECTEELKVCEEKFYKHMVIPGIKEKCCCCGYGFSIYDVRVKKTFCEIFDYKHENCVFN